MSLAFGCHSDALEFGTCSRRSGRAGLGVIDDAVLDLAAGLTVVTGETGAGKTMIVQGLVR